MYKLFLEECSKPSSRSPWAKRVFLKSDSFCKVQRVDLESKFGIKLASPFKVKAMLKEMSRTVNDAIKSLGWKNIHLNSNHLEKAKPQIVDLPVERVSDNYRPECSP